MSSAWAFLELRGAVWQPPGPGSGTGVPLAVGGGPVFILDDCARGDGRAEGAADDAVEAAVVMV